MTRDERDARHELAAAMLQLAGRLETDEPLGDIAPSLELLEGALRELVGAARMKGGRA